MLKELRCRKNHLLRLFSGSLALGNQSHLLQQPVYFLQQPVCRLKMISWKQEVAQGKKRMLLVCFQSQQPLCRLRKSFCEQEVAQGKTREFMFMLLVCFQSQQPLCQLKMIFWKQEVAQEKKRKLIFILSSRVTTSRLYIDGTKESHLIIIQT